MRTFFITFILSSSILLVPIHSAHAEIPARAKAFLTICAYGAGGGALLGAASTAFGTSSRAIPQGASLGLYAGIIFGTYVLVSHHQRRYGRYEDSTSPYKDSDDIYGEDYDNNEGGSGSNNGDGGFFDRFRVIQDKFEAQAFSLGNKKRGSALPPLNINLIQYNF